jgi:hypothetical protein
LSIFKENVMKNAKKVYTAPKLVKLGDIGTVTQQTTPGGGTWNTSGSGSFGHA